MTGEELYNKDAVRKHAHDEMIRQWVGGMPLGYIDEWWNVEVSEVASVVLEHQEFLAWLEGPEGRVA